MPGTGTATLDFGAFPGSSHTTVAVTGQTGILSTSLVEAWLFPDDTADHTQDEHVVEPIRVVASKPTAGVGFTIHGLNVNPLNEPLEEPRAVPFRNPVGQAMGYLKPSVGGKGTRIYGTWRVGWAWT